MSLAGVLKLNKLICFYDSNGISIDGKIDAWYQDDIALRCRSYGWHVIDNVDGHKRDDINSAIEEAKLSDKPTMIVCKTSIGYGAGDKQDSEASHGAALGKEAMATLRKNLDWPYEPFELDKQIYDSWSAVEKGIALEKEWDNLCKEFAESEPDKFDLMQRLIRGEMPDNFDSDFDKFIDGLSSNSDSLATRKSSQIVLEFLQANLPELIGGSADLSGSNNTNTKNSIDINSNDDGNYIYYGVREFGMNAVMNGMALHGGLIPYSGTFLVFMDYGRNAVRMASLMGIRVIFVFSHDSIALGEDAPTHQPIEHLTTLRSTPNMTTWRPANLAETAVAWKEALSKINGPTSIILSRQNLAPFTTKETEQLKMGGYFVSKKNDANINLIATGSEVGLAIEAEKLLNSEGINCNVVSVPCLEALLKNKNQYNEIFSTNTTNIVIECGHPNSWYKHTQNVIGISCFGESGKGNDLMDHFGFTPEKIIKKIKQMI